MWNASSKSRALVCAVHVAVGVVVFDRNWAVVSVVGVARIAVGGVLERAVVGVENLGPFFLVPDAVVSEGFSLFHAGGFGLIGVALVSSPREQCHPPSLTISEHS